MNVWITWSDYKQNPDKLQVQKFNLSLSIQEKALYISLCLLHIKALRTNQPNKLIKLSIMTQLLYKGYGKPEHCQHGNRFLWHLKLQDLI